MATNNNSMSSNNAQTGLVGALISSVIALILIVFTDFGGWYGYYGTYEEYGYVGVYNVYSLILLLPLITCFAAISYFSYKGLASKENLNIAEINLAFQLSIGALLITILSAIIFVALVMESDDWWFDAGFYGSFIGSILDMIFLKISKGAMRY